MNNFLLFSQTTTLEFELEDILNYVKTRIASVIEDEVTQRFVAEELKVGGTVAIHSEFEKVLGFFSKKLYFIVMSVDFCWRLPFLQSKMSQMCLYA